MQIVNYMKTNKNLNLMKTTLTPSSFVPAPRSAAANLLAALLAFAIGLLLAAGARAQGTAFTYQGRLDNNGSPVTGNYDFAFALYDNPTNGVVLGNISYLPTVPVINGLFTAQINANNEFGPSAFNGAARWLEISARTNNNSLGNNFVTLAPRQPLTPTPYAITAGNVPDGAITAGKIAPGAVGAQQIAPGAIGAADLAPGSITADKLAPGAAAANLIAGGSAPVGGGGVILSEASNNTNLFNAGYVKLGKINLIDEAWKKTADAVGGTFQRSGHVAVWTGSEMLVWGGVFNNSFIDAGLRYNPATDSWTKMSSVNTPGYREDYTTVWTGTQMIIWGGENCYIGYCNYNSSGARYSPATDSWTPTSSVNVPLGRSRHSAVWTGSQMIIWGGIYDDGIELLPLGDGGRYNPTSDTWTSIAQTSDAPSERYAHRAVWTGTQMIVWGGNWGYLLFQDGGRYNPATGTWSPVSTSGAPASRTGHTALWSGSEMLIWGGIGTNGTQVADGARYNLSANTWSTISTVGAPSALYGYSAIWTGSRMILWGGSILNGYTYTPQNTGFSYSPSANAWINISTAGAPTARQAHTAVWTSTEMIVWGGDDAHNGVQAIGGRYNPTSDTWMPTSVQSDAVERSEHTAVWTGSEMLIFGGNGGGYVVGNGGRYNPATDLWSAMATGGAPAARHMHTAVWTGSEMLIWGGRDDTTPLQTGGRYNPAQNVWSAIPTSGAPGARQHHTAVWTGSQMIVWGGQSSDSIFNFFNDGGRYVPASNAWVPLTLNGAPSSRTYHTAVWTGTEMLIWGGRYFDADGDGARYNPASNAWTPVSPVNAPSPRARHTAVWTGSEMIVWGGESGTNYFNTGARYNPVADVWSPMSTLGVYSGRSGHTAVWAGNQMIVLGSGSDNPNGGVFAGASYLPSEDKWNVMVWGNVPPKRYSYSAVWDGTEMLVWGGVSGTTIYKETYAYTPARSMYLYLKP